MSQSTRSGSKHAQRLSSDEREVDDALFDRTDGGSTSVPDQVDVAEDGAARP